MAEDGLPAIIYNILDLGLPLVHINALYAVREPDTCSAAVRVFFVIPLYFHAAALCTIVPELGITHVLALTHPAYARLCRYHANTGICFLGCFEDQTYDLDAATLLLCIPRRMG